MENTSWLRQTSDKPLFPDILWSRPENQRLAGKLLIIGGHSQSFGAVSASYSAANKAGIGSVRVVLPDKLQKILTGVFPEAEYAPSTFIGSFSRQALDKLLEEAEWADGVLLAGDFGRNSETAILLESILDKYKGRVTLAGDSVDYFLDAPHNILQRRDTVITTAVRNIQKLAQPNHVISQRDDLGQMVKKLSIFTESVEADLITLVSGIAVVASRGRVSTTPIREVNETEVAAFASVWWLQQPDKTFESISTAIYECNKN